MVRFCTYLAMALLAIGIAATIRPASAAGIAGEALRFDGGTDFDPDFDLPPAAFGDFVNVPDSSGDLSLTDFTLEAWVLVETGPGFFRQPFVSKGPNFGNYALSVLGNESLAVPGTLEYVHDLSPGNFSCCGPGALDDQVIAFGEWAHVAVTYDGVAGEASTYINGQFVGDGVASIGPLFNAAALFLGRLDFLSGGQTTGTVSTFYQGLMDEVRVWNIVRTPQQIAEFYNKVVGPSTLGLVANYHFDEGSVVVFDPDTKQPVSVPAQEVIDSAAKPPRVLPNDGTLGLNSFASVDDPERVDSTAPLIGSVAECPVATTATVCPAGTEDSIVVFYNEEPAFSVGPARCTCSDPAGPDPITVEECNPDSTGPNPCFPEDNEVFNSTVLELISTDTNPRCKKVCFDIDGMRVCEKICKK